MIFTYWPDGYGQVISKLAINENTQYDLYLIIFGLDVIMRGDCGSVSLV